ncbi:multicopper oxidase family protein [Streptomyces cyaneofuscatus]|uniref:multicopper oxidase family protein n=1 Tax=Streptomyces cyaneofuscatus TaxID=66883 RepID=UPI003448B9C4
MVENLFEQNILWALLTAVLWGFAARGARRLATRPTVESILRRAGLGLILLCTALLVLAVRVALALALGYAAGWRAGADYVLLGAMPLALAGAAVLALAVPAYLRLVRTTRRGGPREEGEEAPPGGGGQLGLSELRGAAARARLVVPVQTGFVAALLGAACTLHPPAPPYTGMVVAELALLGAASGALLLLQQGRRTAVEAPRWHPASRSRRLLRATATVTALAVLTVGAWSLAAEQSRLPGRMGASGHRHSYDTGGGAPAGGAPARTVGDLSGDRGGRPDRRFTMTAAERTMRLKSGEKVAALTFNDRLPGPELRVLRGELVEVVLVNRNVGGGVTVHWHGVDVPNAEDGVAGVTQDAVRPGGRHVYRFRPDRAGTFWYHSHQQSGDAVARGLFGAFVVEEPGATADPEALDRTVVAHAWTIGGAKPSAGGPPGGGGGGALSGVNGAGGTLRTAFGDDTGMREEKVPPGTAVRLRLVNADNCPRTYSLAGTPFKVAAIDGNDVNRPAELRDTLLRIAGGGRYDVTFRQPAGPVRLTVVGDANASGAGQGFEGCGEDGAYGGDRAGTASLLLDGGGGGGSDRPAVVTGPVFDPLHYGSRGDAPFGPSPRFDRDFHLVLGNSFGFFDGRPMVLWTINNAVHPDIPALLVRQGDLVRTTFVNRSLDDHPMHLHGHRMLVLSRDGEKATGSPWWTDTLGVAPGERYEVAFRADNPGLWMDHCHNLDHARDGMVLHLAYDGVSSPYEWGRSTGNVPE